MIILDNKWNNGAAALIAPTLRYNLHGIGYSGDSPRIPLLPQFPKNSFSWIEVFLCKRGWRGREFIKVWPKKYIFHLRTFSSNYKSICFIVYRFKKVYFSLAIKYLLILMACFHFKSKQDKVYIYSLFNVDYLHMLVQLPTEHILVK